MHLILRNCDWNKIFNSISRNDEDAFWRYYSLCGIEFSMDIEFDGDGIIDVVKALIVNDSLWEYLEKETENMSIDKN